jgi:hypothetical protein|tara:strand:+ start:427 stop:591 length:165 start_codon:yes stop_codon:yes gene_type:complete
MLKVIIPIIVFIFLVYGISNYWEKAKSKNKKRIATTVGVILLITLSITVYLIID